VYPRLTICIQIHTSIFSLSLQTRLLFIMYCIIYYCITCIYYCIMSTYKYNTQVFTFVAPMSKCWLPNLGTTLVGDQKSYSRGGPQIPQTTVHTEKNSNISHSACLTFDQPRNVQKFLTTKWRPDATRKARRVQ